MTNSVISTQIQDINSSLYSSLITKETYCYDRASDSDDSQLANPDAPTISEFQSDFTDLNNAILGITGGEGSGEVSGSSLYDLLQIIYSFMNLSIMYNYRLDLRDAINLDSETDSTLFLGDFANMTLSRDDDWYFYTIETGDTRSNEHFAQDIDYLENDAGDDITSEASQLQGDLKSAVQSKISQLLYFDPEILATTSKPELYLKIFYDFGYRDYLEGLDLAHLIPTDPDTGSIPTEQELLNQISDDSFEEEEWPESQESTSTG